MLNASLLVITCPLYSIYGRPLGGSGDGNTNPHAVSSVIDHRQINIKIGERTGQTLIPRGREDLSHTSIHKPQRNICQNSTTTENCTSVTNRGTHRQLSAVWDAGWWPATMIHFPYLTPLSKERKVETAHRLTCNGSAIWDVNLQSKELDK